MTITCPLCLRPLPVREELIAAKVSELRAQCEAQGIEVTFDGFVSDAAASEFMKISRGTLRNRRYGRRPIPFRRCAGDEYSLQAIAAELLEVDLNDGLHDSAL